MFLLVPCPGWHLFELLERQAEILSTLYGDGMELSDEELESSMTVSGQLESETDRTFTKRSSGMSDTGSNTLLSS